MKKRELIEKKYDLEAERTKNLELAEKIKTELETKSDDLDTEVMTQKAAEVETLVNEIKSLDEEITGLNVEIEKNEAISKSLISSTKNIVVAQKNVKSVLGSKKYEDAFVNFMKTGNDTLVKSLTTTVGEESGNAGVLVPTVVSDQINRKIKEYGGALSGADRKMIKGLYQVNVIDSADGALDHDENSGEVAEEGMIFSSMLINPRMVKKWISWTDELQSLSSTDLLKKLTDEFLDEIFYKIDANIFNGTLTVDGKGYLGVTKETNDKLITTIDAAGEDLSFKMLLSAIGRVKSKPNQNVVLYMNQITYFDNIMSMTDLTGRPIYNIIGDNKDLTYFAHGHIVKFTDNLPTWDNATAEESPIVVLADKAYTVNAPNGFSPQFVYDPYTLMTEDKVRLLGRIFSGGRLTQFEGASKIVRGEEVTVPAGSDIKKEVKTPKKSTKEKKED